MYRCKPYSLAPVLLIRKLLFCSSICLTHFFLNLSEPRWRRNPFIPNQNILIVLKLHYRSLSCTVYPDSRKCLRLQAQSFSEQHCPPDTGNLRQRTEIAPRQLYGDAQAALTATLGQPLGTAAWFRPPPVPILAPSLLRSRLPRCQGTTD